jgi:hypothetical protein
MVQQLVEARHLHTLPPALIYVALAALALVVLAQIFFNYRTYLKVVSSIDFGIATVISATAATMLGTFVIQTTNQTVFFARYGLASPLMTWLYLNDLFHSAWFGFLLVLLTLGLSGAAIRRKAWRWRQLGFLLSHCGIIIVLLGGAVGQFAGEKGVVNLQVGETASKFDEGNGKTISLPFLLRLKGFLVEKREPEFRLYVVEKRNDANQLISSCKAAQPGVHKLDGSGEIEILSFDPGKSSENSQNGAWTAAPSVKLRLRQSLSPEAEIVLGGQGPTSVSLGVEGRELRFAKKSDDIANFVSTLAVEKNGVQVYSRDVRVNQPMHYQGYSFYQASYDPKNPRYSGIMVVRDPGLAFVYVGLVVVLLGVLHMLILRPRRSGKEAAAA